MPPDGYADVDNGDDTDLNGIISVFINCEEFQKYFTADLSNPKNICDKVRDVGKHIRHAPGLEVTDDDLKVRLTDLKTLFADPTFNKENPLAQDALDQLDQLEKDKLVIRPSDIEAALDLKKVVVELGSGLERKASALGDVLDCKTDEGVNAIQDAKDRAIQDISGLSEEKQASFKSDLNKTLIKYHRENNSTLTLGHFLETIDGLDDFYIPPNISIVIPQSMQTYETSKEHTTKPLENLEQLFSSKGIIILTADAGVGKTSFCKFLVASWCKVQEGSADVKPMVSGTPTVLRDIEYLKKFIYLFYINLLENQCDKLEDIIFSHTESVDTKLTRSNTTFDKILDRRIETIPF
ncbi:uncharacterized protein LOC128206637 [Mya arenaria]|uniref:uncharacterized protein LOC128206637 n=1 Tax=Mya arenaria TaxID=6604 RepID=UPI0022E375D4|nr:uncharacterized protein LOC128206637 [Mya arenaria]